MSDGYHHGNLRAALLEAGLALVAERGANGFTLREVARRAGVSHAAPYHHFADRSALVSALIAESYRALGAALGEATAEDPVERIAEMGTAYVRFALRNPQQYRLMFRAGIADGPGGSGGQGGEATEADLAGAEAFGSLVTACEAAVRTGRFGPTIDAGTAAAACWSVVHGAASLLLDGALGIPPANEEHALQVADRLIEVTLRGLAA